MKNKADARERLQSQGVPLNQDFHTLDSETVERIVQAGKLHGYRKRKNANGSYARMFYEYANR